MKEYHLIFQATLSASSNHNQQPGHMTPRRVKRRAHHRSSARTFSSRTRKSSLNRSAHSLGSEPRAPRANVVNTAAQRHPDSSTSNDEMMRQAESSYGQINPAYERVRASGQGAAVMGRRIPSGARGRVPGAWVR